MNPADDGVAEHILLKRRVARNAHPASWEDYLEWQGYEVERGKVLPIVPHMGGYPPERTSGWPKRKPLSEREKRRIENSWQRRIRMDLNPHIEEFIAIGFSKAATAAKEAKDGEDDTRRT